MKNNERYFKVIGNDPILEEYTGKTYPLKNTKGDFIRLTVDDMTISFLNSEVEEVFNQEEEEATTTPASEHNRVFSTGSQRDNDDHKPLVNHLAPYLRLRYGYHLRKGAGHYGKGNWKLGQPKETAIESLNRHLALYELNDQLGLQQDEDHLSAMIFNIKLILENEQKQGIQPDHFFKLKHEAKK